MNVKYSKTIKFGRNTVVIRALLMVTVFLFKFSFSIHKVLNFSTIQTVQLKWQKNISILLLVFITLKTDLTESLKIILCNKTKIPSSVLYGYRNIIYTESYCL